MAFSLYTATVSTFEQILTSISGVLEKGKSHCEENGIDLNDIVETRLIDDMLPFRFQVVSVAHHSMGAIEGAKAGVFGPPRMTDESYEDLQKLVTDAKDAVAQHSADDINALEGKPMEFRMGSLAMPFKAEDFLLTFSLPNFYFHATTTYDILRSKGVTLGKGDFLGRMRLHRPDA